MTDNHSQGEDEGNQSGGGTEEGEGVELHLPAAQAIEPEEEEVSDWSYNT